MINSNNISTVTIPVTDTPAVIVADNDGWCHAVLHYCCKYSIVTITMTDTSVVLTA